MSGCEVYHCKKCGSENTKGSITKNEFSDADGRGVDMFYIYCEDCEYEEGFKIN